MSFSVSTLLTRNLHDVFGENDAARRRAAIDEIFTEDCMFYEPSGRVYRGRDEIDRVAGTLRAMHPVVIAVYLRSNTQQHSDSSTGGSPHQCN